MLSPGQLLFRADTAGLWQVRVLDCVPGPQVELHPLQPDQDVHPMAPVVERKFDGLIFYPRVHLKRVSFVCVYSPVLHSSAIRDPGRIKRNTL